MSDKNKKDGEFGQWYLALAKKHDLSTNPNHPLHYYNYRAAWESGAMPGKDGHLPSQFKHELHPNRFITEGPKGERLPSGSFWDTRTKAKIVPLKFKANFDRKRKEFERKWNLEKKSNEKRQQQIR